MAKSLLVQQVLIQLFLIAAIPGPAAAKFYPYKACPRFPGKMQVFVKDGKCSESSRCESLVNCTTYRGSIIVREAIANNITTTLSATFPALREITGFLVVVYFRKPLKFTVFPNLAVIRGQEQIVHYSLVVYRTMLQRVGLPSLTVIKSGGVRFDHNSQMCYIKTVKWRSIVLDKGHTVENFGISLYKNNENCFDRCLGSQCIAPSGHESVRQQYCYGPGSKANPECQKLCATSCGPHGCVDGKVDLCCHKECLGGCFQPGSNKHCYACMNYRSGIDGACVSKCPPGQVIVGDFECSAFCGFFELVHDGKCVMICPAGYVPNRITRSCVKCLTSLCPKDCYKVGGFKVDGISTASELSGCTVIKANIEIEIRAGPSNIMQKLEEFLGKIQKVEGYVKVAESEVLTSLSFFENLRSIQNSVSNYTYALLVMGNSKLKSLWKPPGALSIGYGSVLIHGNINLCEPHISAFNMSLNFLQKGGLSVSQNGYLCLGDYKKFNISVYEIGCRDPSGGRKCVQVSWFHDRNVDSRSRFFIVHYRISNWTVNAKVVKSDNCSKWWCRKDVDIPEPSLKLNNNVDRRIKVLANLTNLIPFTTYEFFVEMYSLETGNGRRSYDIKMRLSESVPGAPIGLRAAYLSTTEMEISWQPPENENGVITEYRIYYDKKSYSFWDSKLDWCTRHVSSSINSNEVVETKNQTKGYCQQNVTSKCAIEEKGSRILREDRNFLLFSNKFQNELIGKVFEKNEDDGPQQESNDNGTEAITTTATPICKSNQTNCKPTKSTTKTVSLTSTRRVPTTAPPSTGFAKVNGKTLKYVIKNLTFFQEYNVIVCPCSNAGCLSFNQCPNVFGQTDASATADQISSPVKVEIDQNEYRVNWTAPSSPNGVILVYDIRTRNNLNEEKRHCILGSSPTAFVEKGAAPGNYSIRIQAITPAGKGAWSKLSKFNIEEQSFKAASQSSVVIGLGSAAAVLLLLFGAFLYLAHVRRKSMLNIPTVLYASDNADYQNSGDVYVPDEWEVPRDRIELIRELGKGSFGMVFEGIAHKLIEGELTARVAVKTVNEKATMRERIDFLQEASIMKAFDCYHIVKLLGIVSQGQPTLVVMELMERGDMKGFLRSRRPGTSNSMGPPALSELLQMAAEIADGMSYLSARKFVHRDLAARNCMVGADFTVKIGDFGMTRDVYDTDYYRKGGKGLLPVRWMAPESLYDGVFTISSDVWSYGIVLWEMATLAAQPYPGKSNEDVLSFVIDGGILEQPDDCPDRLYNMMCNCWKADPRARPSFLEIVHFLENDVCDSFEEVSYYHEMKRRLLEITNTTSHSAEQASNEHARRFMSHCQEDVPSLATSTSGDWMTEADRDIGCKGETCQGVDNAGYSGASGGEDIRWSTTEEDPLHVDKLNSKPGMMARRPQVPLFKISNISFN